MKSCLTYNQPAGDTTSVSLPLSKSVAARLLVIALLSGEDPHGLLADETPLCDDLQVMLSAVDKLHALHGAPGRVEIDLKDSGTAKHLLTALCACTPDLKATLHMSPQLASRPCGELVTMLGLLSSARIDTSHDRRIHIIGGRFLGMDLDFKLDTSRSSQPCSALMLVAAYGRHPLRISISPRTVSAPYIDMTARLMQACGATAKYDKSACKVEIRPAPYSKPSPALLERDMSAAAFFYLHALLSGREIVVEGASRPGATLQGDAAVADIFNKLGVRTLHTNEGGLHLCPGGERAGKLDISMRDTPDLVPAVAVACAMEGVPFLLRGISHLRYKESDRLEAVREVLHCFGVKVDVGIDSLEYDGQTAPHAPAGVLPVFGDHRMAMALAQTAVRWPGIELDDTECVKKSFPDFWVQMERLGVRRK